MPAVPPHSCCKKKFYRGVHSGFKMASRFPLLEPSQVVCYEVVFLAVRALHYHNTLFVRLSGELFAGAVTTDFAGVF